MSELTMKKMQDTLAEMQKNVSSYNVKFKSGAPESELKAYTENLKNLSVAYRRLAFTQFMDDCVEVDSEQPIKTAFAKYHYSTKVHHPATRKNERIGIELVDSKRSITISEVLEYFGLSDELCLIRAEHLGEVLSLRIAKELGLVDERINQLKAEYSKLDRKKEEEAEATGDEAAKSTSNNQVEKLVQRIVDDVLFIDSKDNKQLAPCKGKEHRESGAKNAVKIIKRDLFFLERCYTKKNEKEGYEGKLIARRTETVLDLVGELIYMNFNKKSYDIEVK